MGWGQLLFEPESMANDTEFLHRQIPSVTRPLDVRSSFLQPITDSCVKEHHSVYVHQ